MGNFISLLGGIAKGAGTAYGDIAKEKRETKIKQDQLVSDAILKELQTNDTLDQHAHEQLSREYYTRMGVPKADIEKLIAAKSSMWKDYNAHKKSEYEAQAKQSLPALPQQTSAPTAADANGISLPGQKLPETGGLGPLPAPPFKPENATVGQVKYASEQPILKQKAKDSAEAARQAAREAAKGTIEDKIAVFKEYEGSSMEDEVRYMLNMAPRSTGSGVESRNLPGNGMRGEDLIEILRQQGKPTEGIHKEKLYNVTIGRDGKTVIGAFPKEESAIGSGKETSGVQAQAMGLTTDLGGAPIQPGGTYTVLHSAQGGKPLGVVPTTQLESYAVRHNIQVTTNAAGDVIAVPVTESTRTGKNVPGVAPGAATLGPVPAKPAALNTPDTALGGGGGGVPAPAGDGAFVAPDGSKKIGERPVSIPEGTVEKINVIQDTINQTKRLQELLPKVSGYIGPISGRLSDLSLDHLGGLGLPEDAVDFLTNIRELIANKAFARGGKTLPMSEQRIYTAQLPKETDHGPVLAKKLSVFLPLFEKDLRNQMNGLTKNQKKQFQGLDTVEVGGPMPERPAPGAPSGKILVVRKADGKRGSIDAADFDPSKYEKR